jgi:hypothetical protein
MKRPTLAACLAVLTAGCGSSWTEKASEHGRFRVDMPEPVTELAGRVAMPRQELLLEGYGATAYRRPQWLFGQHGAASLDAISVTVQCADVSTMDAAERSRLAAEIAALRREERQRQNSGKMVSEGAVSTAGCAGVETEMALSFSRVRERVCVTSSRACLLTVIGPESKVRGAEADRFLESFTSW